MGILRSIESRLERVVEGSFGRLFRASVAPVELARKLAKELEEGKVVSVTQTYAPNEYTVYLSPRDRTRFAEFEASLRNELASYLSEHARRAGYVMPTRPRVRFETESSLHTGIFGISTALVRGDEPLEPAPVAVPEAPAPPPPPPVEPAVRSPLDPDPDAAPPVLPGLAADAPVAPLEPLPAADLDLPPLVPDPDAPAPGSLEGVPEAPLADEPGAPAAAPETGDEGDAAPALPGADLPHVPLPPPMHFPDAPHPTVPSAAVPPTLPEVPAVPSRGGEPARSFELPAEPPVEATMISRPAEHEQLAIVHDGQRTPIEAAVVQIGRAPSCDIVLDDRNVSRRHAEIRRRGPVVVLVDLDSTNGTIVNGRRVREHPLADGDRITLGNSRLTFERRAT